MKGNQRNQQDGTDGREIFAKGLGLFSIGLGLAEICASRELARLIGVKNRPAVFAALGAREILSGIGILAQRRPAGGQGLQILRPQPQHQRVGGRGIANYVGELARNRYSPLIGGMTIRPSSVPNPLRR